MTRRTTSYSSSNNFWSERFNEQYLEQKKQSNKEEIKLRKKWNGPQHTSATSTLSSSQWKGEGEELLCSVDDVPDFHDPFSDLNLFLSQEIKEYMRFSGCCKKWSVKLQEELLTQIAPKFQQKFPTYHLGISALRKTWEKISSILQQIQNEKQALTQEGKLNLSFFIRQNLKHFHQLKGSLPYHPTLYAQQLAVKMSECMAAIDGIRPELDELTRMIWSVEKHLLDDFSQVPGKSPYDVYDKIDQLIVKQILEICAREPLISQQHLEHLVKESLKSLQDLPNFSSIEQMMGIIAALVAERFYPNCSLYSPLLGEEKEALFNFVRRQIDLYRDSLPKMQLSDLVRRITALYTLASQLPKNLSDEEVCAAVREIYPTNSQALSTRHIFPQSLFAFISAELVLAQNDSFCHSIDYVCDLVLAAYRETKALPSLNEKNAELIEIVIWKVLNEKEGILEKLPYRIGHRIEEEMGSLLVQNPKQSYHTLIQETAKFFKQARELTLQKKWHEIEKKIHNWVIQGEMIYRFVRLNTDSPLFLLIRKQWQESNGAASLKEFISEITQIYLQKNPELSLHAAQLNMWVSIFFKFHWYSCLIQPGESSFDRFVRWHISSFTAQTPSLSDEHLSKLIEEQCRKSLPLIPLELSHLRELLSLIKKENASQSNAGKA